MNKILFQKAFQINPQKTAEEIETFIKKSVKGEKCSGILIGVSGGVDSATSLTLAVRALGKQYVFPLLLPYGRLNDEGTQDAWLVIDSLKIPHEQVRIVDIKPFSDSVISYEASMDDGRKGNIMARMRMVVLYDLSKKLTCLVVGTENKTEHLLGYYTRFGDEASDIEPIKSLYKTQVYMLAEYVGVPQKILKKSPAAGLWEGQTDEGEFGFSYYIADEVLYLFYNKHLPKEKILARGYDKKIIERLWWWIQKGTFKDKVPLSL